MRCFFHFFEKILLVLLRRDNVVRFGQFFKHAPAGEVVRIDMYRGAVSGRKDMLPHKIYSGDKLWADWEEPTIDEIIAQIEYAYHNRGEIRKLGKQAVQKCLLK